ncbi:FAD-dependent oxidoreductase 2 FAD binding domain-containing protein [Bordetella tumbae]|uniref:FAD-dependent oxidoreductase n=1 Tax=Bordetella tumbae TaxID=1649139 RepID=UPI0039F0B0CB
MTELEADVIVIGAGIAGLVTALRLTDKGLKPLVLEQGDQEKYPCNTRIAGGAFHVAHQDVADDPQVIRQAIVSRTQGSARQDLIDAVADNIGEATRWLQSKGVRFMKVGHESYRKHTLAPPILTKGRNYWEGRGGDVLLRTLASALEKAGGRIQRGARGTGLLMRGDTCVGLRVEYAGTTAEIPTRSVVICDGGFHSNIDLLREFISPAPEKLKQRNAKTGNGDGLAMARAVGAKLTGLNRFYGHVLAQDAMHNDDLWPFPMMDFVCAAGIVVNASGQRFMDEGLGGVTMANAIATQADPLGDTVIFDSEIWNTAGREYLIPANPTLLSGGGTLYSAPDLAGLANQLEIPVESLQRTVAQYNHAIEQGQGAELVPARSNTTHKPHLINKAPFHAVKLCAGITYTMGGIAIDGAGRVLDQQDNPISGLYAAGCSTGGLEGGDGGQVAYIGGLTRSMVIGLRAADDIAAHLTVA